MLLLTPSPVRQKPAFPFYWFILLQMLFTKNALTLISLETGMWGMLNELGEFRAKEFQWKYCFLPRLSEYILYNIPWIRTWAFAGNIYNWEYSHDSQLRDVLGILPHGTFGTRRHFQQSWPGQDQLAFPTGQGCCWTFPIQPEDASPEKEASYHQAPEVRILEAS